MFLFKISCSCFRIAMYSISLKILLVVLILFLCGLCHLCSIKFPFSISLFWCLFFLWRFSSDFQFSVVNMAEFSSLCSNEFRTLIVCILTFGPLRKCTKPQDIRSHHIRSYLYGQMPKNVVLVTVLIITQKSLKIQKGTLHPAPESPGWYREGLNHLKKL